jgi:hypothetical protein
MNSRRSAPLRENRHVRELLAVMKANNVDAADLIAIIGHVGTMERQLDNAVIELQAMRRELSSMREAQEHPAGTTLRNAVRTMETNVGEVRRRLESVKTDFVEDCKNTLTAVKEKGIDVLNNLSEFFRFKKGLQSCRDALANGMASAEKSIAKIETFSKEYHQAESHIKNMARTVAGKETEQDVKPVGKLAKALEAPYKAACSCMKTAGQSVEAAIGSLERLEEAARPSVIAAMKTAGEQVSKQSTEKSPEKAKNREPGL